MDSVEITILPDENGNTHIDTAILDRLNGEKAYLVKIFSSNATLSYSLLTGLWNTDATLNIGTLTGGQTIHCELRSASGYSQAGSLNGFRVSSLIVNSESVFKDTIASPFGMVFVPYENSSETTEEVEESHLPPHVYDSRSAEIYIFGLKTADDCLAILHEIEHGNVGDKRKRNIVYAQYKIFSDWVNDKIFAQDELAKIDAENREDYLQLKDQANFVVNSEQEAVIRAVLSEESRADKEVVKRRGKIWLTLFPNDSMGTQGRLLLHSQIETYLKAAELIGFNRENNDNFIKEILDF
jgi:hypothetical protein